LRIIIYRWSLFTDSASVEDGQRVQVEVETENGQVVQVEMKEQAEERFPSVESVVEDAAAEENAQKVQLGAATQTEDSRLSVDSVTADGTALERGLCCGDMRIRSCVCMKITRAWEDIKSCSCDCSSAKLTLIEKKDIINFLLIQSVHTTFEPSTLQYNEVSTITLLPTDL
jgi:hypothetical protein